MQSSTTPGGSVALSAAESAFLEMMVDGLACIALPLDPVILEEIAVDAGPAHLSAATLYKSLQRASDRARHWFKMKHVECSKPCDDLQNLCTAVVLAVGDLFDLVDRGAPQPSESGWNFSKAYSTELRILIQSADSTRAALDSIGKKYPQMSNWEDRELSPISLS